MVCLNSWYKSNLIALESFHWNPNCELIALPSASEANFKQSFGFPKALLQ